VAVAAAVAVTVVGSDGDPHAETANISSNNPIP